MANEKYESIKRVIGDIETSFVQANSDRGLDNTEINIYLRVLRTLYKRKDKIKPKILVEESSRLEKVVNKKNNLKTYIAAGVLAASFVGGSYYFVNHQTETKNFLNKSYNELKDGGASLIWGAFTKILSRE